MNTQQVKILLTVAENGSISKAAKRLFLSQPTVSSLIKAVEDEVGFPIFQRTNHGISVTEKGQELLRHARVIAEEADAISAIGRATLTRRFHLIAPSSHCVELAFIRLCDYYREEERLDFSIRTAPLDEMADLLYQGKADMAVLYCSPATRWTVPERMAQKGLHYTYLGRQPITITVHRDHPLSQGELPAARLNQYPCIIYHNLRTIHAFIPSEFQAALDPKRIILAESRQLRIQLAAQGIGFLAGTPPHKDQLEQFQLVSRPVFHTGSELGYLVPDGRRSSEVVRRFIALFREELCHGETEMTWAPSRDG